MNFTSERGHLGQTDYLRRYSGFLDKLRQARLEIGLTQDQVANLLGKPQSFVSKCETGERRIDLIELADFAQIYGKPLEYFLPD
jgi:transcriptional regulator with XRE-family HTH domain